MSRVRFFAMRNQSGTWSVIDGRDGQVAHMRGVPMVGLGQELAIDLAKLLLLENRDDRPEELSQ